MRPAFLLIRNHLFELRTALREIRSQPKLKVVVVSGFSVCWLGGLSWLFHEGFDFMYRLGGGAAFFLVPRMFTLFFMGLGFMLMLSGAVTGYATLFQTPEVRRLLTWPVPLKDLFYYSMVRGTLMSSWAFFFIIIPFIGAYGVYRDWHPAMLPWSVAFSIPFVMIFSALGILCMLLIVRWVPRGRTLALLAVLGLSYLGYRAALYMREVQAAQTDDMMVLVQFVPGLELASFPLMPNGWMANGILSLARGDPGRGVMYLLLLASSVGVLFLFLAGIGTRMYPAILQRQLTGSNAVTLRASPVSRILQAVVPGRVAARAYGIKDTLIFLRDPSQWSQFVIFFGLLALYFLNLGSLGYSTLNDTWSNLIAFLNMFSLSAVMSSLSARFVFPQLSQESRTLWMVGLAPHSLSQLMMIKFRLSAVVLLTVGLGLSSLSNWMLGIGDLSLALSRVLMPSVAVALAGMSTGLGAIFMETGAKTPAQILSGYGGTLNLILSLVTVILLVLVPGVVSHLLISGVPHPALAGRVFPLTALYIVLISTLAAGIPLALGHRTLSSRDF